MNGFTMHPSWSDCTSSRHLHHKQRDWSSYINACCGVARGWWSNPTPRIPGVAAASSLYVISLPSRSNNCSQISTLTFSRLYLHLGLSTSIPSPCSLWTKDDSLTHQSPGATTWLWWKDDDKRGNQQAPGRFEGILQYSSWWFQLMPSFAMK